MIDVIKDTVIDCLKLIPFLLVAFFIIELIEHKLSKKSKKTIEKVGRFGPVFGSLFGIFPQCGFSVAATNLYITRIISIGTLVAIYLSTSDEMLPMLLAEHINLTLVIRILAIKFIIGLLSGVIIDFIFRNKKFKVNYDICDEEHCDCKHGIIKSSIMHTLKTVLFIFIVSFIINIILEYFGNDILKKIFMNNSILGPMIASLIGLIPNCGASVMITTLFIKNVITLGSCIAGLLTGSGVALLVLFKSNKNIKENLTILGLIYGIGVISGIVINIIEAL